MEKGSFVEVGGAYSGSWQMSNCEVMDMVMLLYVGILSVGKDAGLLKPHV